MSFFRVIKNVLYIYLVAKKPENKLFLVEIFYKEYLFYLIRVTPNGQVKFFIRNGKIFCKSFKLKYLIKNSENQRTIISFLNKTLNLFHWFGIDGDPFSSGRSVRRYSEPDHDPAFAVHAPKTVRANRALAETSLKNRNQNLVSFYLTEKYR